MKYPSLPLVSVSPAEIRELVSKVASRYWAAHLAARAARARHQEIWRGNTVDWQHAINRAPALRLDKFSALHRKSARPRVNKTRSFR